MAIEYVVYHKMYSSLMSVKTSPKKHWRLPVQYLHRLSMGHPQRASRYILVRRRVPAQTSIRCGRSQTKDSISLNALAAHITSFYILLELIRGSRYGYPDMT